MKLKKVSISNFKGLRKAEFEPTDFGCLVGENNAGKSSVLQSISYALNRPSQLPPEVYYDRDQPIEFVLSFEGITAEHLARLAEEHRSKIAELIIDGCLTVFVRYPLARKVEVTTERLVPLDQRYHSEAVAQVFAGKRGNAIRDALLEAFPEFAEGSPGAPNITQAKEYVAVKVSELPNEAFQKAEVPLPSGIASSITALLPEPIYIPAVKDLGDDLKTSQSTSFGRLLGLLLEDMTPDLASVKEALDSLNSLFNRVTKDGQEVDDRHVKVKELESLVESFLSANFPRAKLELRVPPPELKTILNAAQIYIDDGSRDLIENKGDGIKRTMTFALLQAYVHRMQQARVAGGDNPPAQRPLIFLFEEPELYLHPKSQRILFDTLAKISASHQVVVTTHSPLFFAPNITAAFVRVAKSDAEPKPIGVLNKVNFNLDQESAEVFRLARFENADAAFFSSRVVLFEGESDDSYCKHVAKYLNAAWDFEKQNVAMVRVSGKGNFAKFRRFFEAFGIEVKVIADLDALFDGYDHLGARPETTELRAAMIQQVDGRIAALNIRAEPTTRQIRDKVGHVSWRDRYQAAKAAVASIRDTGQIVEGVLTALDDLFVWEQPIARVKACREDAAARSALTLTIDSLRQAGICILSRGAIEDYYPANAPHSGPKPERALVASRLVTSQDQANGLSEPLGPNRQPELVEIFSEIFRGR